MSEAIWTAREYGAHFEALLSEIALVRKRGERELVIVLKSGAEHVLWYDNWMPMSRDMETLQKAWHSFKEES